MAIDRKRTYKKRERLLQLQAFCYAARFQSMTRAAEHLHMSQPAVSMQVRELEHELEAVLFERRRPRIALTRAGESLFEIADPLVETMERLGDKLSEKLDGLISGELRITAGPGAVSFVLPRYVKQFRDEYPGIRLRVSTRRVSDALQLVSDNEADLAVGAKRFGSKDFDYYPAFSYHVVVITPEDHPLAGRASVDFDAVSAWPAVAPHAGTYARRFGEDLARKFGFEFKIAVEARGWHEIKAYVEAGLGISAIPDICITESDRLSVIPLSSYVQPQSFGFFARTGRPLPPPAERFIRTVDPNLLPSPTG